MYKYDNEHMYNDLNLQTKNTGLLNDNEIRENKFYYTLAYSYPWLDRKVYI